VLSKPPAEVPWVRKHLIERCWLKRLRGQHHRVVHRRGGVYYLLGSAVEVVLLVAIVRMAWISPRTQVILSSHPANVGDGIGREEPLA
jgi:hypothetical protein